MRCAICEQWSFFALCSSCRATLLSPSIKTRTLASGLQVTSFFPYTEIQHLLTTKHTLLGHPIYRWLAQETFKPLGKAFVSTEPLVAIPIDDHVRYGYSHTAIFAKALTSNALYPLFNTLRAGNALSYAGQSLAYRQTHPRDFLYTGPSRTSVILVDDVVTTGETLRQAQVAIEQKGSHVLQAFVLADASR